MREILTEWRALPATVPALRSFGRTVGGVLVVVAAVVAWRRGWDVRGLPLGLGGTGAVLVLLGLVVPRLHTERLLAPLYRAWMLVAVVLGFVMTRVILTGVFFLLVTPTGLVRRALGHDPMQRRWPAPPGTLWRPHEAPADAREAMERLF